MKMHLTFTSGLECSISERTISGKIVPFGGEIGQTSAGKVERTMSRFGGKMQNIGTTLTQSLTLPIIALGAASLKSFADIEKLQNGLIAIIPWVPRVARITRGALTSN